MAIEQIRNELNTVYDEMLALFIKQMELSLALGKAKAEMGKPLRDRKRDEEILQHIAEISPNGMQSYSIEFFRELLQCSSRYFEDNK